MQARILRYCILEYHTLLYNYLKLNAYHSTPTIDYMLEHGGGVNTSHALC